MNMADLTSIANHVWQSTLFAGLAGLLTLAFRKNRARVRYGIWLAASCKFFVPLSWLIALGGLVRWRTAVEGASPNIAFVVETTQQFAAPVVSAHPLATPSHSMMPTVIFVIWVCGFVGISCAWWIRWRRIRAMVRNGPPVQVAIPIPAICSRAQAEPGVFGLLHPVLILPEGICERLAPKQLRAVIAHEMCHIRHRDNLTAALHMVVETVFWFHPLVWWIGKRMVEERERACDEEVLRMEHEPRTYADAILRVCRLYVESPLECVSGVAGANLKRRIESIIRNRHMVELNFRKKLALGIAGMTALLTPVGIGMLNLHQAGAQQVPDWQTKAGGKMAFEVASIKLSQGKFTPPNLNDLSNTDSQEHTGGYFRADFPLWTYITFAYKIWPTAKQRQETLAHLPKWIETDRYTIEARAPGDPTKDQMRLMMQALLADRFQLAAHFESKELPVFALVPVKAGKLGPNLLRHTDGAPCDTPPSEFGQRYADYPARCDSVELNQKAGAARLGSRDATLNILASAVANFVGEGRPVIDKTGLSGRFDFTMKWMVESGGQPQPDLASMPPDAEPSALQALRNQLGLRLESTKALVRTLVIDRVERPSEN